MKGFNRNKPQPFPKSPLAWHAHCLIIEKIKNIPIPDLPKDLPGTAIGAEPDRSIPLSDIHPEIPKEYRKHGEISEAHPILIIGAGMAGLYSAMILQSLGLPFEILEGSERIGGRAFTHRFSKTTEYHDYYDVGAMRFPYSNTMQRTFDLFDRVGLGKPEDSSPENKVVPYKFSSQNTVMYYNQKLYTNKTKPGTNDVMAFQVDENGGGADPFDFEEVPTRYKLHSFRGQYGANALLAEALYKFKRLFVIPRGDENNDVRRREIYTDAWTELKKFEGVSTRTYLRYYFSDPTADPSKKKPKKNSDTGLPTNGMSYEVVQWMETMTYGTGWFDRGFAETILEDIDFAPLNEYGNPKDLKWYCIDGGTETVADAMVKNIDRYALKAELNAAIAAKRAKDPCAQIEVADVMDQLKANESKPFRWITTGRNVTAIIMDKKSGSDMNPYMKVRVRGYPEYDNRTFSHVITTVPMSCLRCMDLSESGFSPMQMTAIRSLEYGPSIKIGIKFKTRWWQHGKNPIIGGQTKTDLPIRTVVYPSYGIDDPADKPGVLIASYCWTQDSSRLGSMIRGKGTKAEESLIELVYRDLAVLHKADGMTVDKLREQTLDYYAHDFYHNEYTQGAFAFFNPGQYDRLFPEVTKPAALGNLHLCGEAASTHHAWIVGALDSAWRGVSEILWKEGKEDKITELINKWGVPDDIGLWWLNHQIMRGIKAPQLSEEEKKAAAVKLVKENGGGAVMQPCGEEEGGMCTAPLMIRPQA